MEYYRDDLVKQCKSIGIKDCYKYKKPELIKICISNGLIKPPQPKPEPTQEQIEAKKCRLRKMRQNPIHVTLRHLETGEECEFPSIYKASQFSKINSGIISKNNGRDCKGYHITLHPPKVSVDEGCEEPSTESLADLSVEG